MTTPQGEPPESAAGPRPLPALQDETSCLTEKDEAGALSCQGCAVLAGEGEDAFTYMEGPELRTADGLERAVRSVLRAWRFLINLPAGALWPGWTPAGTPLLIQLPGDGAVMIPATGGAGEGLREFVTSGGRVQELEGFRTRWLDRFQAGLQTGVGDSPVNLEGRLLASVSLEALMLRCPSQRAGDVAASAFRLQQRRRWEDPTFDSSVAYPRRNPHVNALGRVEGWLLRQVLTGEAPDPRLLGLMLQARHQRRRRLDGSSVRYERSLERLEGSALWVSLQVYRELGALEKADELVQALERHPEAVQWHWRHRFPLTGMAVVELLAGLGFSGWERRLAAGAGAEDLLIEAAANVIQPGGIASPEKLAEDTPLDTWLVEEKENAEQAAVQRLEQVEKALAGSQLQCVLPQGARLQVALSGMDTAPGPGRIWEAPLQIISDGLTLTMVEGWLLQDGTVLRVPLEETPAWETEPHIQLISDGLTAEIRDPWEVSRRDGHVVLAHGAEGAAGSA